MKKEYINKNNILMYISKNYNSNLFCKDCGKLIIYPNTNFYIIDNNLYCDGYSGLTGRYYNNHVYHLQICCDCLEKKFLTWKQRKKNILRKTAKYTQYAFQINDIDFKLETRRICGRTKESFIKNYGHLDGIDKWNSYIQKQSITNTFQYKHEKYGMNEDDFKLYNKNRSSTLENFMKRHGESKGKEMWNEYVERQRYTCSKEYFIFKYGEIEGTIKYDNFCKARFLGGISNEIKSYSNIADDLFFEVKSKYPGNEIYTHVLNYEYNLNYKFNLDYYDKTLNIVIEFYGDFWHCNPIKYKENDLLPPILRNKKYKFVKDIWKKDEDRIHQIEELLNGKVFIVWEYDYRLNKEKCITKLIHCIENYTKSTNFK